MKKHPSLFYDSFFSRVILLALLLFINGVSTAQFTLRIRINVLPALHDTDQLYVAGNFNNWNPGDAGLVFSKKAAVWEKEIKDLAEGIYEFKFTRGDWGRVEVQANGDDMGNRVIKLSGDTTVVFDIAAWKDDLAAVEKRHTVSPNVKILDTAFYMPQLDRSRRIWIYLPHDYAATRKRYPVLYMQDGQNVFDSYTSGFGEWGVDECLDTLIKQGRPPCIVVGIDNGPQRMNEYDPFDFDKYGKGEGDKYVDFLALTLKPFIDQHYRTLITKANTIIAGSSMGGLISYYAMLKYPAVFGKAGIFSPAFWTAPKIKTLTDSLASTLTGKLFFYMGELEGETHIKDMVDVMDKLGENSRAMIYSVTDPVSNHNELAWRKWFDEFYTWIIADGYNKVIELGR